MSSSGMSYVSFFDEDDKHTFFVSCKWYSCEFMINLTFSMVYDIDSSLHIHTYTHTVDNDGKLTLETMQTTKMEENEEIFSTNKNVP